jgi:hypothetical protein
VFRWDANNRFVLLSTFTMVVALFLFYGHTSNSINRNLGWPGAKGSRIRLLQLDIDSALVHGNGSVERNEVVSAVDNVGLEVSGLVQ